ncbi:MAG: UDP-N-acetylglucosamine pyrophosphorylase [Hydrocarboniphaga sp.]|uniref:bifunctional UDP-N-acetylglucosamine diphosphorylase/glucosamine-1-phosphate N-acetyltransferase GlmU n=1 Tax=Hydrocarboniphaga sp. TaxID=2033016 RepID=UPI002603E9A7|nr:bifunctional UDP-N-acetylglucosamine diphosphorylase/glucosamine-1-phosphate N-acetyltransferase GlmU [Hydrocarboniphaga sp.]MDB5973031.1 UDP-N-acetylglucosamine pyrophosphorylase [Hydrocarboniphaga sp.]
MKTHAIILAAGRGTRMNSALPKVLHTVGGRPMLAHVLGAAAALDADAHLVLGHGADLVQSWLTLSAATTMPKIAVQAEQLGTAHAVQQALPEVPDDALVVVLYGDVPLVGAGTLAALQSAASSGLALVTVTLDDPSGYGRIQRDAESRVIGIVEQKDASAEQRAIREINTGLLAAPAASLKRWIAQVQNHNASGEYYLTDVVALAVAEGVSVQTVLAVNAAEVEGVNDRVQLARAERLFQLREAERAMRAGVQLADPARFDLRGELLAGRDVFIDVGVIIEGRVELADGVRIGAYSHLKNVKLGLRSEVLSHCVLENLDAGADCRIGPFARVRMDTQFADEVHIGNFVEIKKSRIGRATKAGHLAYIGDALVGADVNIGAGVITCNYDGANKHVTTIGDGAFIGTDTQLVAPVTVGDRAFIAAGSTITRNVADDALAICRARDQRTITGWKRPQKKPK